MSFMPLGRGGDGRVSRWCLVLTRAQGGLVYVFAGLAKLSEDWTYRAEPIGTGYELIKTSRWLAPGWAKHG